MQLIQFQIEFAKALTTTAQMNMINPHANLIIHKNTILTTHVRALTQTYPFIVKLIGENCFKVIAKDYTKSYPSTTSNLYNYGEHFGDYIAHHPSVKHLYYLKEIAQLEWQCHSLYYRNATASSSIAMHCHYPVLDILDLCQGKIKTINNLQTASYYILICISDDEIKLRSITRNEYMRYKKS